MDKKTDRTLLILDVDETLIFASETPLEREADFRVGPYFVYRRPHLEEFLRSCARHFQLAVWSASSTDYLSAIVNNIFPPGIDPVFMWSRERCCPQYDPESLDTCFVKDLKKVKRLGFSLDRMLIVEDNPRNVARNHGNAVFVTPFRGDTSDKELPKLAVFLRSLADAPNVRRVEKRGWNSRHE